MLNARDIAVTHQQGKEFALIVSHHIIVTQHRAMTVRLVHQLEREKRNCSSAELSPTEKNQLSHRARAMVLLRQRLGLK